MTNEEAKKYIKSKMCNGCGVYLGGGKCSDNCKVIEAINTLEQESKSECQQDHEILKAYSNGANDMLDKIKAEMANHIQTMDICNVEKANGVIVQSELTNRKVVLYDTVLHIIDEYKEEGNREIDI